MARLKTLNQMIAQNENLLNFVVVPSDVTDINVTALKQAIVRRCGDVEPYYQRDTDFQLFGALWFNSHKFLFAHAVALWNATYNPIENYDRTETETIESTRTGERDNTDTHSGTDSTTRTNSRENRDTYSGADTTTRETSRTNADTHGGTDTTTTSGTRNNSDAHSGTDTTTRNLTDNTTTNRETGIAGFNSSDYSDANNEDETSTATKTGTEALQHGETITSAETTSGTETLQHGETISSTESTSGSDLLEYGKSVLTNETTSGNESLFHGHKIESSGTDSEDSEVTRNSRIHGNIGVTTAQQMIEAELELANRFWIYDYIASAFESDNFITVYRSYYDGSQFDDIQ